MGSNYSTPKTNAAKHPNQSRHFGEYVTGGPRALSERFQLESNELGHGHYGSVSRCKDINTGEWFACKRIKKSKVRDLKILRTEIDVLQSLDHPSVIRFVDVFEDDRILYIVMELCTGGELFDRIIDKTKAGGAFGERDATRLMRQILEALSYCHRRNIVHRDLKPENFLFRDPSEHADLVIIDFGLSRVIDKHTSFMTTRVGTPYYIAPEVLAKHYNAACDLWSAGVIMYILLCGAPPFHGDREKEVYRMIQTQEVQFPESFGWHRISGHAKDLIQKLLTKDAHLRPTAEEALNHPWFRLVEQESATNSLEASDLSARLHSFVAMNKMKRITLNTVANELTDREIGNLKRTFAAIDTDNNGVLSVEELQAAFEARHGVVHNQIQTLMLGVDINGDEQLDYKEFLAATMEKSVYAKEDRLQRAFDYFSKCSDQITVENLMEVLGNEAHARDIIRDYDIDGDGKISFQEFKAMILEDKKLDIDMVQQRADSRELKFQKQESKAEEKAMDARTAEEK